MRPRAFFCLAALFALGCGSEPSGPTAGDLTVSLTTPRTDDGGIVFTVNAPAQSTIEDVSAACAGCQVFWRAIESNGVRIAVTGQVVGGPVTRISVSDTRSPDDYTTMVEEVATRTFDLVAPTVYTLSIE